MLPITQRRRTVMKLAHGLRISKGWPISTALKWAWRIEGSRLSVHTVGTRYGRRSEALERLSRYPSDMVTIGLVREPGNAYDAQAVAVVANVRGVGSVVVGYLSAGTARLLAPLMDGGQALCVCGWEVTQVSGLRMALAFGKGRERAAKIRIA